MKVKTEMVWFLHLREACIKTYSYYLPFHREDSLLKYLFNTANYLPIILAH